MFSFDIYCIKHLGICNSPSYLASLQQWGSASTCLCYSPPSPDPNKVPQLIVKICQQESQWSHCSTPRVCHQTILSYNLAASSNLNLLASALWKTVKSWGRGDIHGICVSTAVPQHEELCIIIVYHHAPAHIHYVWIHVSLFLVKAKISPCLYYHTRLEPHLSIAKIPMHAEEENHKPRLCKLIKSTTGFGFRLNAINNIPGVFIKEVLL